MKTIYTVAVGEYEVFAPLFEFCVLKAYPECQVKFGDPHDCPGKHSANCLRFLEESYTEETIITDVDLLWFRPDQYDHWEWHRRQGYYAGHHGPYKKPYRPEINKGGWTGNFERVAGGFFYCTPRWYDETRESREKWMEKLRAGEWGNFRESDEVMLARILKENGMLVPQSKMFPPELRGLHLGDFRPDMDHRWKDFYKMKGKLTDENVINYVKLRRDPQWCRLVEKSSCKSEMLKYIINSIDSHVEDRLKRMNRRID